MPTYSPEWDPGDARANNEYRNRMGFGGTEHGGEQYAQRSRMLGDQAQQRGAYVSDMGQSNETRGQQYDALDLLHGAAAGTAPSQAAILAQTQGQAATAGNLSLAGSVKGGPGARVAAMRNAMAVNAGQQQAIAAQGAAARAGEMAAARGQYIQGATGVRAGDLDATKVQQQNELFQRGANDAQQRFFEQQGTGIQTQDQNNQLQQQGMANGAWATGRAATQSDETFGFTKNLTYAKGAAGAAEGGLGAAFGAAGKPEPDMGSDERMKNLVPMSGAAPATFDKLTPGGGMDVLGSLKAHSDFATRFQSDPTSGMMMSSEQAKVPASLDDAMQRSFDGRGEPGVAYGYLPDAYAHETSLGVTGAPKGYAAERAGQPGSMFSPPPDAGYVSQSAQEDFDRYGAPVDLKAKDSGVDWTHGGSSKAPAGDRRASVLAGVLGGFAGRNTMRSDDHAKLRVAFEEGVKYSDAQAAGHPIKPPAYGVTKPEERAGKPTKDESKSKPAVAVAPPPPPPAPAPAQAWTDHPVVQGVAHAGLAALGGPMLSGIATGKELGEDYARSDEKSKNAAGYIPEQAMYSAMKSMKPSLYAYKDEYRPSEQKPGEVQAGPMANPMAKDPIASTAIVREPSGLLAIDKDKALKLALSSVAVLGEDVEELKKKKGGRRARTA